MRDALTRNNNDLNITDSIDNMQDENISDPGHSSMIRVKIVTSEKSAIFGNILLDTGSHISLINDKYAKKLGLSFRSLEPGDITQIMVANSQMVNITCKVRIQLQIGGLNLFDWAYCVKSLSHNVILGLRFMRCNGVNLLHDRGIAKIRGVKIPFISGK